MSNQDLVKKMCRDRARAIRMEIGWERFFTVAYWKSFL